MELIEIRVKGQLGQNWSGWLGDLSLQHTLDGDTTLTGSLRDQSALYGLLERLSSLGVHLISVTVGGKMTVKEGSKMWK